jgi:hypothetical protein
VKLVSFLITPLYHTTHLGQLGKRLELHLLTSVQTPPLFLGLISCVGALRNTLHRATQGDFPHPCPRLYPKVLKFLEFRH